MGEIYEKAGELIKKEKFNEALQVINDSGIQPEESPELWTLKAKCLEKLKRDDDAFQAASEVIKFGTDNVGILNTLGEGHMRNKDYDSAYDIFSRAVQVVSDPTHRKYFKERCKKASKEKQKQEYKTKKKKLARGASSVQASISEASSASSTAEAFTVEVADSSTAIAAD